MQWTGRSFEIKKSESFGVKVRQGGHQDYRMTSTSKNWGKYGRTIEQSERLWRES